MTNEADRKISSNKLGWVAVATMQQENLALEVQISEGEKVLNLDVSSSADI